MEIARREGVRVQSKAGGPVRTRFETREAPSTERLAQMMFRDRRRVDAAVRFDKETTADLRAQVEDLLEGLDYLIHDNAVWSPFLNQGEELPQVDLDQMEQFTQTTLPRMLGLFGYTHPPPPSIEQLQEEVSAAFVRLLTTSEPSPSPSAVEDARVRLAFLSLRIRRQVRMRELVPRTERIVVRDGARKALGLVNSALPILVMGAGAAAGAVAGGALTGGLGAGLGAVAGGAAASKMVEEGVAVVGRTAIEMVPSWGPNATDQEVSEALTPSNALETHWIALQMLYERRTDYYEDPYGEYDPAKQRGAQIADLQVARRHLWRLHDLSVDLDLPASFRSIVGFAIDAVERQLDASTSGSPDQGLSSDWLAWVGHVLNDLMPPDEAADSGATEEQKEAAWAEVEEQARKYMEDLIAAEEASRRARAQGLGDLEPPAEQTRAVGATGGWESEEVEGKKQFRSDGM